MAANGGTQRVGIAASAADQRDALLETQSPALHSRINFQLQLPF